MTNSDTELTSVITTWEAAINAMLAAGADEFSEKPLRFEPFQDTVNAALAKARNRMPRAEQQGQDQQQQSSSTDVVPTFAELTLSKSDKGQGRGKG